MSKRNEFIVQYSGLNLGVHTYEFEIGKSFFESFDIDEIGDCQIKVTMNLDKSAAMLVLDFVIGGVVTSQCDLCLEDLEIELEDEFRQIIKISDYAEPDDNDEIVVVPSAEYEIDVTKFIYDFVLLSIPLKKKHKDGECNEEALEKLKSYLVEENPDDKNDESDENENIEKENIDPRWQALINLKNKEN